MITLKTINVYDDIQEVLNSYDELKCLKSEYPEFEEWFHNKVMPGLYNGTRIMCIAKDDTDNMVGILILKPSENKICTLKVPKEFQGKGIGNLLMEKAFEILGTAEPMIAISESHIEEFKGLLDHYRFKLIAVYHGYYGNGKREYSFNGTL